MLNGFWSGLISLLCVLFVSAMPTIVVFVMGMVIDRLKGGEKDDQRRNRDH